MKQLSLFEVATKRENRAPKVGEWIWLNPISDSEDGGRYYTSGEIGKVTKVENNLVYAIVPKTHEYHDVFTSVTKVEHLIDYEVLEEIAARGEKALNEIQID